MPRVQYGNFINEEEAQKEINKRGFKTAEYKREKVRDVRRGQVEVVVMTIDDSEMPEGIGSR